MASGEGRFAADAAQFGSAMNSINQGNVMLAAIKDYTKELEAKEAVNSKGQGAEAVDVNELLNDEELQQLHEERINRMKAEHEKRAQLQQKGHGQLQEITEGEFLEVVTKTELVVCHFFHRDFERCKIMDKHLAVLARKYFHTRFIKLSAPDSPFFTVKLNVKMLPCIICFRNGVAGERVVGFDGLGAKDDFATSALEDRLYTAEMIHEPEVDEEAKEAAAEVATTSIRKGFASFQKTASDEDSDFDD